MSAITVKTQPGWLQEEATCAVHGVKYNRFFIPDFKVWTGQCPECKALAELERQAREILPHRLTQKWRRVADRLAEPKYEKHIQKRTEEEVKQIAEDWRPTIAAEVRQSEAQRIGAEIEGEMLAEIVAELRAKA